MKYIHLGRSGVLVSRVCLGTMNFGSVTSETDSHKILDKAIDNGINFIDTANVYGNKLGEGVTEQVLGRWFDSRTNLRDKVFLSTKAYCPMGHGINDRGSSAYHIRSAVDASLKRLKTDHIDLFILHHIDRGIPNKGDIAVWNIDKPDVIWPKHLNPITRFEEIWEVMESLILQGKISYVGLSNFPAWAIVQGMEKAIRRNFFGPVTVQNMYNLNQRTDELEIIPACREYGIGYTPWSPLAGGLLAGALEKYKSGRRASLRTEILNNQQKLEKWEELCSTLGYSPAEVALAWLQHNPIVTSPIIGPRTLEQLISNVKTVDINLDNDTLNEINKIWKPMGEAPESYSW
ncbi:MAG: aldo/keto reductase [Candidatus Tenebribacter mawsonii]|nr:aldo/keto reductase [Candidatus Tenebribacter mawsonii]